MHTDQNLALSSRRRRISAFLIDHFVVVALMTSIIFSVLGSSIEESIDGKLSAIMLSVMLPGFLLYFVKDIIGGVSLGKWFSGIMIRDADNVHNVPAFGRLVGRNLFLIIWPVEFFVLALSREKRRLGDITLKTVVVDNPNKPKKLYTVLVSVGIGLVIFAFVLLSVESMMKDSGAYKAALYEISHDEKILKETGGIEGYGMFTAGNIHVSNGVGEAYLEISVSGSKRDVKVSVYLTKEPDGKWEVIELKEMD